MTKSTMSEHPKGKISFEDLSSEPDGNVGRDDPAIRFGRFCVLPQSRQLLADGRPILLGSRAFDILLILLKAPGTVVSKESILNCVWPSIVVEESNLRVQMAALRNALGEYRQAIKTVPGRGYVFCAEVKADQAKGLRSIPRLQPAHVPLCKAILPASPDNNLQLGTNSQKEKYGAATVIVIDDDRDIRDSLDGLLRSVGLDVETFASANDFLNSQSPSRPGCMVLDVSLPGRNGLDFHEDLVKANIQLPVVFISGHADIPMSVRAMKAGAIEFLTKPVRHADLLAAILSAINLSLS